MTGISAATLRVWERRYNLVSPARTEGGYRTYDDQDVERLRRVKELVDTGYKVSEAIALVQRDRDAAAVAEPPAPEELRSALTDALLALDRARADTLVESLALLSFQEQVEDVLCPMLRRIGVLWECGKATVAQEHFASAFVRERLALMLDALGSGSPDAPEAVLAGVPGEHHELGLMAAAVHLALGGWRITYLGADLPLHALSSALQTRRPALVCSSLLCGISEDECMTLARELRGIAPEGTQVLIGGPGIPDALIGTPLEGVRLTHAFPAHTELAA